MTRVSASNPQDTDQLYFTNRYGTGNFYLGIKGDPNLLSVQLFENLWFLIDEDLQPQNQKKPDEISLADAWSGDFGSIVLLGSASTNHQLLTRGLKEKLVGTRPGLLWLANPNDAFEHWNLACAEFVEEKISSKILATRQLKKDFRLGFSADANGYGLCAAEKSLFNLDAVSGLLQITPHTDNADGVSFCRGDFTAPISSQSIDLQLGGSYGIAFNFELMTNGGMATTDWFDQFDVGIRYASASESGVGNTSQRFPVFQPHSATPALAIKAQIIPTHLLEPDLTRLAISWSEEVLFLSWFRTVLGNQIFLSTRRMDLSFALAAPSEIGRTPEFYTLVVGGKFSLSFANLTTHDESKNAEVNMQSVMAAADANPQFLCGISGSEYVEFDDLNNIKLALLPGYPAFALAVNNTRRDSAVDTALIPATTTSWIQLYRIQQSDDDYVALPYYAQPAGNAILYKIREVPESPTESAAPLNDVDIPIYPYFAIQAGQVAYDTPIPLISLAGIGEAELPFASLLEVTSISTERRSIIATDRRNALVSAQARPCLPLHPFVSSRTESAAQNDAEEKITIDCITPQGLEAQFARVDGVEQWLSVKIAEVKPPTGDGRLVFESIKEPLHSALLSNQQFMVVSDPDAIAPFFKQFTTVTMADWIFELKPDRWSQHNTILILKNADASLRDLAADPSAWTSPRDFNTSPAAVSKSIMTIIEQSEQLRRVARRESGDPDALGEVSYFDFFLDMVVDAKDWNGFLFLNAPIGNLPPSIAGLRAGIDEANFFAHHLGVTQTAFKGLEALDDQSTALFGLILYHDRPANWEAKQAGFAFRVEQLGVLFRHSAIKQFRGRIELFTPALFDQPAVPQNQDYPVISLLGSHQKRGGHDTYLFGTRDPITFTFSHSPLTSMRISQMEFQTLTDSTQVNDLDKPLSRSWFGFVGGLGFADPSASEFDFFSYSELRFDNLGISLVFPEDNPKNTSFEFDCSQATLTGGEVRDGSLAQGFPVTPSQILRGFDGLPGSQGFMTVDLPVDMARLNKPWYGISLDIDLGTVSDVAGNLGFVAKLVTAWSPGSEQGFVGLKLPGSAGEASEISLLGVLKLDIHSLGLRRADGVWALMLYGMNVKVFGKILPPNGAFTFYLFGNPDASGGANSLGWYGAYLRNPDKKQGSQQRSLPRQPALPRVPNLRQHAGLLSLGAEALSLQNRRVYSGKILKTLSPKN